MLPIPEGISAPSQTASRKRNILVQLHSTIGATFPPILTSVAALKDDLRDARVIYPGAPGRLRPGSHAYDDLTRRTLRDRAPGSPAHAHVPPGGLAEHPQSIQANVVLDKGPRSRVIVIGQSLDSS